jgi:gliding motility-associated protein GldM
MSIPKEPRQLMINLMYLVLTALLALNVSAEIFNAFKLVDDGLTKSNNTLELNNAQIPGKIRELAQKNQEKYAIYADRAEQARVISKELIEYIEAIKKYMIDETGGWNEEKGQPIAYKNKDITTRYMVGPDPGANKGKGGELEVKINETAQKFLQLVDEADLARMSAEITLVVDDAWKQSKTKKNWAHYNFFQMPLLSVLPILSKIENDCRATEASILNYLRSKAGGESIEFDSYRIVSAPKKSYIIAGETYETEIFLAASSSNPGSVSMSVNGSAVKVENGVAKYSSTSGDTGVKKYTAKAIITNPVTGEVQTVESQFEYEVGRRSASVQLDKMMTFYIGVDNPITVSAAGVSSNELRVTGSDNISISPNGPSKYVVRPTRLGPAKITLSGGGLTATSFEYRVKPIPSPTAEVGGKAGGTLSPAALQAQRGVIAVMPADFDFDARCTIESYLLNLKPRRGEGQRAQNRGASFTPEVKRIIDSAASGDAIQIVDIKCKCPGDAAGQLRDIPPVVVQVQ